MADYFLPPHIGTLVDRSLSTCKNLGLILDKYPTQLVVQETKNKSTWLKEIKPDSHIDQQLAVQVYERWLNAIQAVQATRFDAHTDWRMVVGLGGETVLETDLTLHHIYSIPFIPGSALKGLTRAYVTNEVHKPKKVMVNGKEVGEDQDIVKRIFGTQKDAGSVIFFDAMPINANFEITLDIMNAHYPDYYGEKKPPTNDQDPKPITFLTVSNATFTFALAARRPNKKDVMEENKMKSDVEQVQEWLQLALQFYGVGGKTSAGYGTLTVQGQQGSSTTSLEQNVSQIEEEKQPAANVYVRPTMPKFTTGQGISGKVVPPSDELRKLVPEATAFLRFWEFPLKTVLMVVTVEEAASWMPGQTRNCVFSSEEERAECTVIVCQPGVNKKKKG